MKSRLAGFNSYLVLLALALGAGCKSSEERKRDKTYATFRLYLEVNPDASQRHQVIEISGTRLAVATFPFLDETSIERAAVVDTIDDGYALRVQYDRHGTLTLDSLATAHRGGRIAIFTEFGVANAAKARWLGAPIVARPLTDGMLLFTPNATREEADEIVLGVKNVTRKIRKQSKF